MPSRKGTSVRAKERAELVERALSRFDVGLRDGPRERFRQTWLRIKAKHDGSSRHAKFVGVVKRVCAMAQCMRIRPDSDSKLWVKLVRSAWDRADAEREDVQGVATGHLRCGRSFRVIMLEVLSALQYLGLKDTASLDEVLQCRATMKAQRDLITTFAKGTSPAEMIAAASRACGNTNGKGSRGVSSMD
jgi:hypothetical protein